MSHVRFLEVPNKGLAKHFTTVDVKYVHMCHCTCTCACVHPFSVSRKRLGKHEIKKHHCHITVTRQCHHSHSITPHLIVAVGDGRGLAKLFGSISGMLMRKGLKDWLSGSSSTSEENVSFKLVLGNRITHLQQKR